MVAYRLHHTALKMCIVTYHGVFVQENTEQNGRPAERGCRLLSQAEVGTELGQCTSRAETGSVVQGARAGG